MKQVLFRLALATTFGLTGAQAGIAQDESYHEDFIYGWPDQPTEAWILSRGGRLYDNWYEALGQDGPDQTHPAWPAANTKKTGAVTNRCKSCHGWDYRGAAGKYGSGSYQTGITGVDGMQSGDIDQIKSVIRDNTHGFTDAMIPERELGYLATFIARGAIDPASIIDNQTGDVSGNADAGAAIYQTTCAACHGFDGKALDFSGGDTPEYVGTIAQDNPWEALHKIRNGQPGVEMIAMRAFDDSVMADLLAYLESLPAE